MANTLVIAELSEGKVRKCTHSAINFARQVGGTFSILVIGSNARAAAVEVTGFGAAAVLTAEDAALENPIAERCAPTVAGLSTYRRLVCTIHTDQ